MTTPAKHDESWKTRPGVRAVVVDDDGRILILLRPKEADFFAGYWNLPGGGLDPGERSHLEGAKRELLEETGLVAEYTGISMPFTFPGGTGKAFLFRAPSGAQKFPLREVAEARWVYPNELPARLMPPTAELVAGLVGNGERFMKPLELTTRRRWLESLGGQLVAPWLEAMVRELARKQLAQKAALGDRLEKSVGATDAERAAVIARFEANEGDDRARLKLIHEKLDTDGMGETAFVRVLTRAVKMGRAEAAAAVLADAKRGKLPAGKRKGFREATMAGLQAIARRHLRQVKAVTERQLANIAMQPEGADVQSLLAKLYDTYRSDLIGQNLVAEGYVNGVCDLLKEHGYNTVWARSMGDDRVCSVCKHFETTPDLARMTIRQFLKRFPLHPKCRCWPAPSPTAAQAPLNWKAPRAKILKGMIAMQTSLTVLRTMVEGVTPDMVKSFAAEPLEPFAKSVPIAAHMSHTKDGKVVQVKASTRDVNPAELAKEMAEARTGKKAPAAKKPKGGAKAADLLNRAGAKAKADETKAIAGAKGKGKASGTGSPDHLIAAAQQLLTELRQLKDAGKAGSDEHQHKLKQYNALRTNIQAFNQSKGQTATPAPGQTFEGTTKLGDAPAWVPGGSDRLRTAKQFEIAVAHAETRDQAVELAHYFERLAHNEGHAGKDWDSAWGDIKGAIKALPPAAKPDERSNVTTPEPKAAPAPGEAGYAAHFTKTVKDKLGQGDTPPAHTVVDAMDVDAGHKEAPKEEPTDGKAEDAPPAGDAPPAQPDDGAGGGAAQPDGAQAAPDPARAPASKAGEEGGNPPEAAERPARHQADDPVGRKSAPAGKSHKHKVLRAVVDALKVAQSEHTQEHIQDRRGA